MPAVEITLAGRRYTVMCDAGEEPRLLRLTAYLDGKVAEAGLGPGVTAENRQLLLAGLTAADELFDALDEIARLRTLLEEGATREDAAGQAVLEAIALRLERLAAALDAS